MNIQSRVIPSWDVTREPEKYVKAQDTNLKAQWAQFFAEHKKPETDESYQRSVLEETR